MREAMYKNGLLIDTVIMSLLREAFYARHSELQDRLPDPVLGLSRQVP